MNTLDAITIIEGDAEADFDTVIEAWQALIDTGLVWRLQGFYGRMAHNLITQGVCQPPSGEQINLQ